MKSKSERFGLLIDIVFPASWDWPQIQKWRAAHPSRRYIQNIRRDRVVLEGMAL